MALFLRDWFSAIALVVTALNALYLLLTSGSKANTRRIEEIEKRIEETEKRIELIEAEWKHLPDKESVHRLELALGDMKGQLISMSKESEGTHRALLRMEDYLLKTGGKQQ